MPFEIEGWIEVARLPETTDIYAWFGVVRLSPLVDVADGDTERLFGLSKQCVSGEMSVDALADMHAAMRGLPTNPSAEVRRDLERIAALEEKYGPGDFGGYTYAVWSEIRDYVLIEQALDPQLGLAFDFARILEQRYGADRVRFVVWYCW